LVAIIVPEFDGNIRMTSVIVTIASR
jgi:hypothetical protein